MSDRTQRLAILHPTGILADELRETLERKRRLWENLKLYSTHDIEIGQLTDVAGEAAMITRLEPEALDHLDIVFFCGPIANNRPWIDKLSDHTTAIVLSPDATLDDGVPIVGGINIGQVEPGGTLLSPHPATVALAHLLAPLSRFTPGKATATLLQPASVHSRAALDEILDQARSLLAFQGDGPRDIYPTQMPFNIIGPDGTRPDIDAQLRAVLGDHALDLRLQIARAGIFHGYAVSLHVELEDTPDLDTLHEALASNRLNAVEDEEDRGSVGPVASAGRDEVLIGDVQITSDGVFIWAAMDNLTRGGATNALEIFEALVPEKIN